MSSQATTDSEKSAIEPVKNRKRKNNLPNVDANFSKIQKRSGKESFILKPHPKSSRGLHNGTSRRRSKYIGVLKNGFRWQVLINVGRTKKYIGTFCDEKQAALVHDFYAIGLNATNAKTNFAYNEDIVLTMIDQYYRDDCTFDPALFIDHANFQD